MLACMLRYAEKVYGGVFKEEKGEYTADLRAKEEKRKKIRKERLNRSDPTKEWMNRERTKY